MINFSPPNAPFEEGYWEALINGGESGGKAAPPIPSEDFWIGLDLSSSLDEPKETLISSVEDIWERAMDAMRQEDLLKLPVVGYNRGGLLVDWDGCQGFVPSSHLADLSPYLDEKERENELQERLDQVLCLKVIEVDPGRSRLILSERATRSDEERRQMLLNQLNPGDIRKGRVTNLCSFGAFVDLGGVEGLVHISEISWGRVNHPSDVLRPGEEAEVYVLNVDEDRGRIGLSIKRALPDPWEGLEDRYHPGEMIDAVITNVVNFGAFAQVEDGVEGLIHVSELAEGSFLHPRNVVREGEHVRVRILNVDGNRRRLGLSLRRAS
jgi:small subunit ribosomal protein S1